LAAIIAAAQLAASQPAHVSVGLHRPSPTIACHETTRPPSPPPLVGSTRVGPPPAIDREPAPAPSLPRLVEPGDRVSDGGEDRAPKGDADQGRRGP
jgi:hypothetical protein